MPNDVQSIKSRTAAALVFFAKWISVLIWLIATTMSGLVHQRGPFLNPFGFTGAADALSFLPVIVALVMLPISYWCGDFFQRKRDHGVAIACVISALISIAAAAAYSMYFANVKVY